MSVKNKKIYNNVIQSYRKEIKRRYNYKLLSQIPQLPDSFDEPRVKRFVDYALAYLYPPPETREQLDAAFSHLDEYVKNPKKLIRIILDSSSLVFRFGRHLPKMLKAGLNALRSFNAASEFEDKLVEEAIKRDLNSTINKKEMYDLIGSIPRAEIEEFMNSTNALFEILHDRKLVKNIITIIQKLTEKMKESPEVYSEDEVNALEVGLEMISKGDQLFGELSKEEQALIFDFVILREKLILDEIFE